MVEVLESGLQNFTSLAEQLTGIAIDTIPKTGAAGGLGAALLAFTQATLKSGIDIVLETLDVDSYLSDIDLVITAEGCIDGQSVEGKVVSGLAKRAKKYDCPVIALAGQLSEDAECIYESGVDAIFCIMPSVMTLKEAMENAPRNIEQTTRNVIACYVLAKPKIRKIPTT
jgi:glycerate kinase